MKANYFSVRRETQTDQEEGDICLQAVGSAVKLQIGGAGSTRHLPWPSLISNSIKKPMDSVRSKPLPPSPGPDSDASYSPGVQAAAAARRLVRHSNYRARRCFTLEYKTLIKLKFFHEIMKINSLSKLASTNSQAPLRFLRPRLHLTTKCEWLTFL